MPFQIKNLGDCFHAVFTGVVTPADLSRFADEVELLEDAMPVAIDRITDMTAAIEYEIDFPAVLALAERRRARRFPNPVKSVLVARMPVEIGLARMFQMLNDHPQIEIRIMESCEEAKVWFAKDVKGAPDPKASPTRTNARGGGR